MRGLFIALGFVLGVGAAQAQDGAHPALYDVTGVAANDVLNVRAEPSVNAPIIGTLAPDALGIEVVRVNADETWGQVNVEGMAGWASLSFMRAQMHSVWHEMDTPLYCYGTEPFWGATIADINLGVALQLDDMNNGTFTLPFGAIASAWGAPGRGQPMNLVTTFREQAGPGEGVAVLRGEACNDGMSDQDFGISVMIVLSGDANGRAYYNEYRGCCSVQR